MKTLIKIIFVFTLSAIANTASAQDDATAENRLILILDASGSMWGQIGGVNKIVIARESVGGLIDSLPAETEVGLIAYGHRREGDCVDIEVLQTPSALDREGLKSTINAINPKGKTPITASINAAVDLARNFDSSSIVLISDGLETCDMDPCDAVRSAKADGVPFVLHVVGFDVSGEDTSSLECAAQAGEGLYMPVDDAASLSKALVTAYEKPAIPDGRLVVKATAEGNLQDALVKVVNTDSGEEVVGGRTYESDETNPRSIPLEDGNYHVTVSAVRIKGSPSHEFDIEIRDGNRVERAFDFSRGALMVGVTRNGDLSDATVRVFGQDGTQITGGRTYDRASGNPTRQEVAAGTYDIEIMSIEIEGDPKMRFEDVVVQGGEETAVSHEFISGSLRVGTKRGDALVDSVVSIYDSEGRSVGGRRTYDREDSNPTQFDLLPGTYSLRIQEVKGDRFEEQTVVEAGQETMLIVDLMGEGLE